MFTGIVEELGTVVAIEHGADSAQLRVRGPLVTQDAVHGSSIAVNGVCLTVTDCAAGEFAVDVMAETLRRTGLGGLVTGERVNLERAMPAGARFGGHIVQGHIDGTATIAAREPGERWEVVRCTLPPELAPYLVAKGSITVDGVSLTVVEVTAKEFSVSLIPTTLELTTLGVKVVGDTVNLEVDVLAKYVERLLATRFDPTGPSRATNPVDPVDPSPRVDPKEQTA